MINLGFAAFSAVLPFSSFTNSTLTILFLMGILALFFLRPNSKINGRVRRNDFKSAAEIVRLINERVSHDSSEQIEHAETLLIFQTSRRQTWLVGTEQRLSCVLDDLNKGFTRVQWILPKEEIVKNGRIDVKVATRSRTHETGLLDIGDRQGCSFSRRLFDERDLVEKIQDMIRRTSDIRTTNFKDPQLEIDKMLPWLGPQGRSNSAPARDATKVVRDSRNSVDRSRSDRSMDVLVQLILDTDDCSDRDSARDSGNQGEKTS